MAADSYIGSLISLTSKSEIRYEGVLYNINTNDSTIGLRNVRSFGTEGRKKDGPQIPASEKIYEYILFRGSDIKDLQVKSSPPPPTTIHNDPAIIQSHYPRPGTTSTSLPSVGASGNVVDPGSYPTQLGLSRPTFQGNLPLHQPGSSLGSWGSPPVPPAANASGLGMPPMYWQGFYAPTNGLPPLQQSPLLQPSPGVSVPPPMQQPLQYPGMSLSLPSGSQTIPESTTAANSAPTSTSSSLPPTLAPPLASTFTHERSSLFLERSSETTLPVPTLGFSLPLVPPLTSNLEPLLAAPLTKNASSKSTVSAPTLDYQSAPQTASTVAASLSSSHVESLVPLVTPGQLLPASSSAPPSSQTLLANNNEGDARTLEDMAKPLLPDPLMPSGPGRVEAKGPILPLPKPSFQKTNGAASNSYYNNRGRGRGNGHPRPVMTKFTEDFDFMAMNEKFNKDEVWGHLGKSKSPLKDNNGELDGSELDFLEEEEEIPSYEVKPVYVKDDFFDSLSSNSSDRGSRNGRTKFSEQLKLDTETFGNSARHRSMRGGGWGMRGGGRARGSYHSRGYGYVGRGRGYSYPNRSL